MRDQKALYGKVAMYRKYCDKCKRYALVLDGFIQCCDEPVEMPNQTTTKRMSENPKMNRSFIAPGLRRKILKAQGYKCIYCERYFGSAVWDQHKHKMIHVTPVYDHFIPWNYSKDTRAQNIVASCSYCNAVKSDKCFSSVDEAKVFILERRELL